MPRKFSLNVPILLSCSSRTPACINFMPRKSWIFPVQPTDWAYVEKHSLKASISLAMDACEPTRSIFSFHNESLRLFKVDSERPIRSTISVSKVAFVPSSPRWAATSAYNAFQVPILICCLSVSVLVEFCESTATLTDCKFDSPDISDAYQTSVEISLTTIVSKKNKRSNRKCGMPERFPLPWAYTSHDHHWVWGKDMGNSPVGISFICCNKQFCCTS
jgi:hypothetical protein